MEFPLLNDIPVQTVTYSGITFDLLRLDLIGKGAHGNKWFKLIPNFKKAIEHGNTSVLTFGGAFSNHIAAFAEIASQLGIQAGAVIRGEESLPLNPTLQTAINYGLKIFYLDRSHYRNKDLSPIREKITNEIGSYYLIEEGGSSEAGVEGASAILEGLEHRYDIIGCAVGTGGTLAGMMRNGPKYHYIGFSVLKGAEEIDSDIIRLCSYAGCESWFETDHRFHFGGYGKINPSLIDFMRNFFHETGIKTDPVYTGKLLFGIVTRLKAGDWKGKKVLAVHTGGLQGIAGMEWMKKMVIF